MTRGAPQLQPPVALRASRFSAQCHWASGSVLGAPELDRCARFEAMVAVTCPNRIFQHRQTLHFLQLSCQTHSRYQRNLLVEKSQNFLRTSKCEDPRLSRIDAQGPKQKTASAKLFPKHLAHSLSASRNQLVGEWDYVCLLREGNQN